MWPKCHHPTPPFFSPLLLLFSYSTSTSVSGIWTSSFPLFRVLCPKFAPLPPLSLSSNVILGQTNSLTILSKAEKQNKTKS